MTTAIRPDDVEVDQGDSTSSLPAKVTLVEYLGETTQVSALGEGGTRVDVRTGRSVRIGDNIRLRIAPEKLLVFAGGADGVNAPASAAAQER